MKASLQWSWQRMHRCWLADRLCLRAGVWGKIARVLYRHESAGNRQKEVGKNVHTFRPRTTSYNYRTGPDSACFRDLPVLPSPEIALVRSPVSWTLRLRCGNWHQDGANGLQGSVQTFSVQQQPLPGRYQLPGQARLVSEQ